MLTLFFILLFLPLVGALCVSFLQGRKSDTVSITFSFFTLILSVFLIIKAFPKRIEYHLGSLPWIPTLKSAKLFGFLLDPLSSLMLLVVVVIGFLVVLYSAEYLSERNKDHPVKNTKGRYYFFLLVFICSMVGIAISPNFLQLFIFWELTTLCSWALISHYQNASSLRAGFKALIMTHIGGLFFMVTLFILFAKVNSFSFSALNSLSPNFKMLIFTLLLIASLAKAAQVPFYTWLPEAMEAPTPISAYLHAAAMVKAGVYLMVRVVFSSSDLPYNAGLLLCVISLFTMFLGVFFYFFQNDLKRLLAFSTITHLAYILFGSSLLILGSKTGFQGAVLHIPCHAVAKTLLFLSVGGIAYATGSKKISDLSGLGKKMPILATSFLVGAFSVTGIPPLSCFWSKFTILIGTLQLGGSIGPILAILVVIESMTAFGWFLWIAQKILFGEVSEVAQGGRDPNWIISLPLLILIILCVVVPFIVLPIVGAI